MPSDLSTFRDKAVVDGFAGLEDFLDTLELMGAHDVQVEVMDEFTLIVSWISTEENVVAAERCISGHS
jgi:hypothetical protein